MGTDYFKCFTILFLLHLVFNLVDHYYFGIDCLQISSRKLKDDSTFGTCDNLRPSFNISHIQHLFLLKFLYFLFNCIYIDPIPNPSI